MHGAPRCVSRRKSDDQKSKLDAEDILGLVSFVDERGAIDLLPQFVAANLERVPPQSDVLDLCLAVNWIAVLESKMEQLMLNYAQAPAPQLPGRVPCKAQPAAPLPASSTAGVSVDTRMLSASATPVMEVQGDDESSPTWTSVINDAANSAGEWHTVIRQRKEKPKPTVRVRGGEV